MSFRHSPSYALGLVLLLVAVQGHAFFEQWRLGFRPLRVAPQRVALSWDMFAVEIERCGVSWDPPSYWQGRTLHELHDLGAPIEWDPIYNRRTDYISAAELGCARGAPGPASSPAKALSVATPAAGASFTVHCFGAQGKETQDEFLCPTSPE